MFGKYYFYRAVHYFNANYLLAFVGTESSVPKILTFGKSRDIM